MLPIIGARQPRSQNIKYCTAGKNNCWVFCLQFSIRLKTEWYLLRGIEHAGNFSQPLPAAVCIQDSQHEEFSALKPVAGWIRNIWIQLAALWLNPEFSIPKKNTSLWHDWSWYCIIISIFKHHLKWMANSFYIAKSYLLTNMWHRQILCVIVLRAIITALYWKKSAVLTHDWRSSTSHQAKARLLCLCVAAQRVVYYQRDVAAPKAEMEVIQCFQWTSGAWWEHTPPLSLLKKLEFASLDQH